MMTELTLKLTSAQLDQLRRYVEWSEQDGTYYGNKNQFDKRHEAIKEALAMRDGRITPVANDKA